MIDFETVMPRLEIFNRFGKIERIDDPDSRMMLQWVDQLDGRQITELVLGTPLGWLTVSLLESDVCIGFCDPMLEGCVSRIVSRQDATYLLIQAMRCQGVPSD